MAIPHFTEYEANQLIKARKIVARTIQDNTQDKGHPDKEKTVSYDVRRRDMPEKDIHLRLNARLAPWVPGSGLKPLPGVALIWWGSLIRKLDHAIRHDSIRHGVSIGHIKGWHEHLWTDEDKDKYVIAANPPVKGQDIRSLVRWAADKWSIELDKISAQEELNL